MISKSLLFMALLLCAILAQTVAAKSKAVDSDSEGDDAASDGSDGEGSDDGDDDSEEEEEEEPIYPSLSCLLFKNIGCNSECSVLGSAFGYKATGTCGDEDDICDCSVNRDDSLDSLWKAKFDSNDILRNIKKNSAQSDQVSDILEDPFRTAQEIKNELESVLSKDQLKNLKLKDDNSAAKMSKNGKPDLDNIKKYVSEKFPATLKASNRTKLSALKVKPLLQKALKTAKKESDEENTEAFNELVLDIRRTKNKSLEDTLTEYLKTNKFKEPAQDKTGSNVADIIAAYIIDELVNKVDEKKPATGKAGKKTAIKKSPVKKTVQKTKSKKSKDEDDEDDDADTSGDELQKDRFVLKNINKSVFQQSGLINQNLNQNGYSVQYQQSWGGNINLVWIKGADEARLQRSPGDNLNQNWKFGDVKITLSVSPGKNINQNWNFGKNSYQYSRSPGGYTNSNWSNGKPNNKMLKKYKGFIDAWCKANDFLMAKQYCVIYDM